jgi:hypothetical protein
MKLLQLLALSLFALSPFPLHAQLGIYGGFTVQNLGVPDPVGYQFYGGTVGAYLASRRLAILNVGIDLRGTFTRSSGDAFNSGAIGPRVGLNLHVLPVHPYVEATAGLGNLSFQGGSPNSGTRFEYQFLGGLDYTVLPRIDWRVAEFSYGGLSLLDGNSFHPKTLTTGLVLRLPRIFPLP